ARTPAPGRRGRRRATMGRCQGRGTCGRRWPRPARPSCRDGPGGRRLRGRRAGRGRGRGRGGRGQGRRSRRGGGRGGRGRCRGGRRVVVVLLLLLLLVVRGGRARRRRAGCRRRARRGLGRDRGPRLRVGGGREQCRETDRGHHAEPSGVQGQHGQAAQALITCLVGRPVGPGQIVRVPVVASLRVTRTPHRVGRPEGRPRFGASRRLVSVAHGI